MNDVVTLRGGVNCKGRGKSIFDAALDRVVAKVDKVERNTFSSLSYVRKFLLQNIKMFPNDKITTC